MLEFSLPTEDDSKFKINLPDGKVLTLDCFDLNILHAEAYEITQKNKEENLVPHFCSLFNAKYKTKISLTAGAMLIEKVDDVTTELKKKLNLLPASADSSTSPPASPESAPKS